MDDSENIGLDFEIDELTNSIRNVITNDNFETTVSRITKADLLTITKRKGWLFSWKQELSFHERDVFKLIIDTKAALKLINKYYSNLIL